MLYECYLYHIPFNPEAIFPALRHGEASRSWNLRCDVRLAEASKDVVSFTETSIADFSRSNAIGPTHWVKVALSFASFSGWYHFFPLSFPLLFKHRLILPFSSPQFIFYRIPRHESRTRFEKFHVLCNFSKFTRASIKIALFACKFLTTSRTLFNPDPLPPFIFYRVSSHEWWTRCKDSKIILSLVIFQNYFTFQLR